MKKKYLEGGRICSAHGVRGAFKAESYCDSAEVLSKMKRIFLPDRAGVMREYAVTAGGVHGRSALLEIEGISSREEAQALNGRTLYLAREDIPLAPGQVLIADLIGMPVIDEESGRRYGICRAIEDGVSYPLITVETPDGDVILPDIPEFIRRKNPDEGIFVRVIPGFFKDEPEGTESAGR